MWEWYFPDTLRGLVTTLLAIKPSVNRRGDIHFLLAGKRIRRWCLSIATAVASLIQVSGWREPRAPGSHYHRPS